jgi:hypothetical protein
MTLKQRLLATPLVLGERISRLGRGSAGCAEAMALPLLSFEVEGPGHHFWHKSSSVQLGEIAIAAGMGGPFRFSVAEQGRATLMVSNGAGGTVQLGGRLYSNHGAQPLLYLPGEAYSCSFDDPHGIALSLPITRLAQAALQLAEERGLPSLPLALLQQPRLFSTEGESGHLGQFLQRTLGLVDLGLAKGQLTPVTPALERALIQQLCVLLFPQLLRVAA